MDIDQIIEIIKDKLNKQTNVINSLKCIRFLLLYLERCLDETHLLLRANVVNYVEFINMLLTLHDKSNFNIKFQNDDDLIVYDTVVIDSIDFESIDQTNVCIKLTDAIIVETDELIKKKYTGHWNKVVLTTFESMKFFLFLNKIKK